MREEGKVIFMIASAFALAGALLLAISGYMVSRNLDYSSNGVAATGTVLGTHTSVSSTMSPRRDASGFSHATTIIAYFHTPDGKLHMVTQQTFGWGFKKGEEVKIRYRAGQPEKAQLQVLARWHVPMLLSIMGAGFALPLLIASYFGLRRSVRASVSRKALRYRARRVVKVANRQIGSG